MEHRTLPTQLGGLKSLSDNITSIFLPKTGSSINCMMKIQEYPYLLRSRAVRVFLPAVAISRCPGDSKNETMNFSVSPEYCNYHSISYQEIPEPGFLCLQSRRTFLENRKIFKMKTLCMFLRQWTRSFTGLNKHREN